MRDNYQDSIELKQIKSFGKINDDSEEIEEEITVEETKIGPSVIDDSKIKSSNTQEGTECNLQKNEYLLKNELLDHFLSFIDTTSELNYVLSGYFSRFFNFLFTKNSSLVLMN